MLTYRRDLLKYSALFGSAAVLMKGILFADAAAQNAAPDDIPDSVRPLLDSTLQAALLLVKDVGLSTYYIVAQYDDSGSGEPVFIRETADAEPVIIEDIRSLPLEVIVGSSGNAAAGGETIDLSITGFGLSDLDLIVTDSPTNKAASADLDKRMLEGATKNLGLSSKNATGTNHGRLACAWAVNRIAELSLGRSVGGGLATANMVKVLKARHLNVSQKSVSPGSIVISPTVYSGNKANIGHVGIVGEGGKIYSNSSARAQWEQNFTMDTWTKHYAGKGLAVQFFRLDEDYFP